MTIYVVTKGDYSDYHIITATLSKQKAENIAEIYSDEYENAEVEAYAELSDAEVETIMSKLELRFVFNIQQDGTVSEIDAVFQNKDKPKMDISHYGYICFSIPANDKEHAIKIARDMRAKYYAEKYGL